MSNTRFDDGVADGYEDEDDDGVGDASAGRGSAIPELAREPLFAIGVLAGVVLFALGSAFFLLGLSLEAGPPAPYLQSTTDKYIILGISALAMLVGAGLVRLAGRVAGW